MTSTSTLEAAESDFWDDWHSERGTNVRPRPVEVTNGPPPRRQRSRDRRGSRRFLRFLITIGMGVGGTLAWQAYGDEARQSMAIAYPEQLGWIAPQDAPAAAAPQNAPAALASAPPAAPSVDPQQLNAISLDVAAVRQSVERLATQLAMGQQQMNGDIAKLQASEQDILNKISLPAPRPAPAPTRKPAPPLAVVPPPPPATATQVR
jgi:hypothetical protein